jgi:hypothetical protein
VGECASFGVTELGVVSFSVPQVEKPTKARLELYLVNGENLIAKTEQEFYIFPMLSPLLLGGSGGRVYSPHFRPALEQLGYEVVDASSQANIAVVSTVDDSCRDFLLNGGHVLLLAEKDDALQTHISNLRIAPRDGTPWQGDWASSLGWHHFESLPTDNVVNFAFADLTPEHVIHGFALRDFALDVYAGLFVGWIQKPIPTIARKRVGHGTLLVSTFRLANHLETSPLARYLFKELMLLVKETV